MTLTQYFWRRSFFIFFIPVVLDYFSSLLGKGHCLENPLIPLPNEWFVTRLVESSLVVLEKKNWFFFFCYFVLICPLKKDIFTNLNFRHPRMLWVWLKLTQRSCGEFLKSRQCIFAFSLYPPFGKRRWTSFEHNWKNPSPMGVFVPSLGDIAPVVLEKRMKLWRDNDDGQRTLRSYTLT